MSLRSSLTLVFISSFSIAACSDDTVARVPDKQVSSGDKQVGSDRPATTPDKGVADKGVADKNMTDFRPYFDGTVKECVQHQNLVGQEPCVCFGVLVYNTRVQYPTCTSPWQMHCCPGASAPKCELIETDMGT